MRCDHLQVITGAALLFAAVFDFSREKKFFRLFLFGVMRRLALRNSNVLCKSQLRRKKNFTRRVLRARGGSSRVLLEDVIELARLTCVIKLLRPSASVCVRVLRANKLRFFFCINNHTEGERARRSQKQRRKKFQLFDFAYSTTDSDSERNAMQRAKQVETLECSKEILVELDN